MLLQDMLNSAIRFFVGDMIEDVLPSPSRCKAGRLPLYDMAAKAEAESIYQFCVAALPVYTKVTAEDSAAFINDMGNKAVNAQCDGLLALMRYSFTEFLYDEFQQLEAHYVDVLWLLSRFISGAEFRFLSGGVCIGFESAEGHVALVFNLRGSAEEASRLLDVWPDRHPDPCSIIYGVSFSAFTRSIDRWVRLS